jgi:hypothetical protein
LYGRLAANYHWVIMRKQETWALRSGFFASFPETASVACAAPSGDG